MKLIGTYVSPYARRVAAALVSRSIPYEHEDLNGYADPVRARALNPVGKVPILETDSDERLVDSAAILDYLCELTGPDRQLIALEGNPRRAALRLSAIATTACEQITARYFELQRPTGCAQDGLLERYRLQIVGGFEALDAAAQEGNALRQDNLDIATISAVIAFEYAQMRFLDFDVMPIAPALAEVARVLADEPAFARTRPAFD